MPAYEPLELLGIPVKLRCLGPSLHWSYILTSIIRYQDQSLP